MKQQKVEKKITLEEKKVMTGKKAAPTTIKTMKTQRPLVKAKEKTM